MAVSTTLASVYATDEDAFNVGGADFGVIVPSSNLFASGADGVFAAGTPWVMSSASNNFVSQGVASGMVVQLTGPAASFKRPQYLAIDSVTTTAITLRRCGQALNVGLAPGPAAGLTGVTFAILSLKSQIENAAYMLNERYSVDPNIAYRGPGDIYDPRIFRRLTVLWVFYQQYANVNRSKAGDFADKIAFYRDEYDTCLATAMLRWGPTGQSQPSSTHFGMRYGR